MSHRHHHSMGSLLPDVSMASAASRPRAHSQPSSPESVTGPLTLLTWKEFQAFKRQNGSSEDLLSGNYNPLTFVSDDVDADADESDESDDEDFSSYTGDDMVPGSLFTDTCVPKFSVYDSIDVDGCPFNGEMSPSMPSTTLEECINTPTFALVPSEGYKAHATVWRDQSTATEVAVSPCNARPALEARSNYGRTTRSPMPQHPTPTTYTPSGPASPKRKRKGKANDELNSVARSLSAGKRAKSSKKKHKHKHQQPRNPLQPKVPNAPAPSDVMRSRVTA